MLWARILLQFEAFGCGFPRPGFPCWRHFFLSFYSGFRRQRFESFSGLRFACFGHESCCCLRLSDAAFQGQISSCFRTDSRGRGAFLGQISSCFRSDSRGAYLAPRFSLLEAFFSFFLVGSVGNVSRVFRACVSRALGTNPAAV